MNENIEINTMIQNMDMWNIISIFSGIGIVANIIFLASFLLKAWGLYNINKKLWEPHPWLAFIPIIQIYSFVKAGWKSWIWILWIILWFIALIIPWIILTAIVCSWIAKRTGKWFWSAVWIFFIPSIMLPIIGYKLKDKDETTKKEEIQQENKNENTSSKEKKTEL